MSLRCALLAVALVLVHAGPAAAQETTVVAGAPPGPALAVGDGREDGQDLMTVSVAVPGADTATETAYLPVWPDEALIATAFKDGEVFFGGAVDAAAASVEIEFEGDQVVRVPTLAGEAYTGRNAGRVRFFLGQVTSVDVDDGPRTIRLLDAGGTVIGVAKSPDTERAHEVLRRRVGGALVRVKAVVTSRLEPIALAPEHRSEQLCLSVRVLAGDEDAPIACRRRQAIVTLGGEIGCGRIPSTLTGFVPDATQRLDVVLGSGRTVRVTPRAAPLDQPGLIVAAVLPRGEAIRSATARDAAGHVLDRAAVRAAPPFRRCRGQLSGWVASGEAPAPRLGRPPGTQLAAALAANGGPQLLVRDAGEELCVAIDRLDLDGGDCGLPPFSAHNSGILDVDPKQGFAFGVYPARVAEVEIRFRGGERLRAPALSGMEYTGRYRDAVHFVLTPLLVGRTVTGTTLLDSTGREIGSEALEGFPIEDPPAEPSKTVLRVGSVRLIANRYGYRSSSPCIGLAGRDCDEDYDPESPTSTRVLVPCDRRRTIVYGLVPSGSERVEIRVGHGPPIRARLARFPRGLGGRGEVYLAVLGPGVEVTGVRVSGHRDTFTIPGRAPTRQCGWEWGDS